MNAGNYRFKLTWSSLWHLLWLGATRFIFVPSITILRLVLLLDVSKWQGAINFVTMFAAGGKGVVIKCGQGSAKDLKFDENWLKAKQAGIPRGTYWFYDSRVDPKTQAANWWNWVKADKGELIHFLDLEESYGGTWKGWQNWKICLQEFMRLSGLPASKIGIYTGYYYWIANSPNSLTDLNWFAQFALWLAWYTTNPANVSIPKPWTSLLFWQFGTPVEGEKFGTESLEIDQSYFNGDEQQFNERFGLSGDVILPPVAVEPPARPVIIPEPRLWSAEVLPLLKMIVRTYPLKAEDTSTSYYVYGGELFNGKLWSGNDYVWMRIEASSRAYLIGKWVAVRRTDGLEKFIKLASTVDVPASPPVSTLPVPADVYRVRKWGDPIMVSEAGLSVRLIGTSNFQAVGLYNTANNQMGGVSNFLRIPMADVARLRALQVEDNFKDKKPEPGAWLQQKMNWLIKNRGTIYFYYHHSSSVFPSDYVEWGTIALGNNLVTVEAVETLTVSTPDNKRRTRKMARLAGFRKTDWGRPLKELLAAGLVHRCYCAYLDDDAIGDSPKGIVYSPFWSPKDWMFIGPAQKQPSAFYVPMDWVVKEV